MHEGQSAFVMDFGIALAVVQLAGGARITQNLDCRLGRRST
jgi:hypothetical protein